MWKTVITGILLATPASADDPTRLSNADLYPPMPGVEYYCRGADGARYEMGQTICVTASCQTWMATCDMSLNSPTWRKIQDGCPAAGLLDPSAPAPPLMSVPTPQISLAAG